METYEIINQHLNIHQLSDLIIDIAFGDQQYKKNAFEHGYYELCVNFLEYVNSLVLYAEDKQIVLQSLFESVCKGGYISIVKLFNEFNTDWSNGFKLGCQSGNLDFIKYVIMQCNIQNITIPRTCGLMNSYIKGDKEIIQYLKDREGIITQSCIISAHINGDSDIVKSIEDEFTYVLLGACIGSHADKVEKIIKLLLSSHLFGHDLYVLCESNIDIFKYIFKKVCLDRWCGISRYKWVIESSCRGGNIEITEFVLNTQFLE